MQVAADQALSVCVFGEAAARQSGRGVAITMGIVKTHPTEAPLRQTSGVDRQSAL